MTELTVLFSTRNGAAVLPRTLAGYANQPDPGFPWKLVIVDNGSTDQTAAIIREFGGKLRLEAVVEPVPGKNRALNRGLSLIEGEIIVISDDDAIPQAGFLAAWKDAFQREPTADVFGGSIIPVFEVPPPDWLAQSELHFEELYASRRNLPEGPIAPLGIYGPNMAVRGRVFADGMRFHELIGPNASDPNYAMGSENDFCVRADKRGYRTWFTPAPTVWHIVRRHQVTFDYCVGRAYRLGRGAAQQQWESGILRARHYSAPMRVASHGWHLARRTVLAARTWQRDPLERFRASWDYQFFCGFQDEHRRRKRIDVTQTGGV
jgi:glycosyltransferase involved in cell wall biosynthesis